MKVLASTEWLAVTPNELPSTVLTSFPGLFIHTIPPNRERARAQEKKEEKITITFACGLGGTEVFILGSEMRSHPDSNVYTYVIHVLLLLVACLYRTVIGHSDTMHHSLRARETTSLPLPLPVALCVQFNHPPTPFSLDLLERLLVPFAHPVVMLTSDLRPRPLASGPPSSEAGKSDRLHYTPCTDHNRGWLQQRCLLTCLQKHEELAQQSPLQQLQRPQRPHEKAVRGILYVGDDVWLNWTTIAHGHLDFDRPWMAPKSILVSLAQPSLLPRYDGTFVSVWNLMNSYTNLRQLYMNVWPPEYRSVLTELYGPAVVATEIQADVVYLPHRNGVAAKMREVLARSILPHLPVFCELLVPVCLDIAMGLAGVPANMPVWPSVDIARVVDFGTGHQPHHPLRFLPGIQTSVQQRDPSLLWTFWRQQRAEWEDMTDAAGLRRQHYDDEKEDRLALPIQASSRAQKCINTAPTFRQDRWNAGLPAGFSHCHRQPAGNSHNNSSTALGDGRGAGGGARMVKVSHAAGLEAMRQLRDSGTSPLPLRPDGFKWGRARNHFETFEWMMQQPDFVMLHPFKLSQPASPWVPLWKQAQLHMLDTLSNANSSALL